MVRKSAEPANGGFPEPPEGDPVRVVRSLHRACGAETQVRIPRELGQEIVRRVVCHGCGTLYAAESAEVADSEGVPVRVPKGAAPVATRTSRRLPSLPAASSPAWRWVGIPVAAILVIGALYLVLGDGDATPPGPQRPPGPPAGSSAGIERISEPGFSLVLPPGWEGTQPERGAAFAAAAEDGSAEATLWIEQAPALSFERFERRSLARLRELTGNAEVVERIEAPTDEGTVVRLQADTPEGTGVSAPYVVTLRAAGALRYYLASTVEPGAPPQVAETADLIHSSFIPRPDTTEEIETGEAPGG